MPFPVLALVAHLGALPGPATPPPTVVTVRLTEWKVEASTPRVPAGPTQFVITNAGTIPHALEVEGRAFPVGRHGLTGLHGELVG